MRAGDPALVSVDPLHAATIAALEFCSNQWQAVEVGNLTDAASHAQRALLQCGAYRSGVHSGLFPSRLVAVTRWALRLMETSRRPG